MSGTEKWNRVPELFGRVSGTWFLCPSLGGTHRRWREEGGGGVGRRGRRKAEEEEGGGKKRREEESVQCKLITQPGTEKDGAFHTASELVSYKFKVTTRDFVAFQASHTRSVPRQFTNPPTPRGLRDHFLLCDVKSVREGGVGVLDVHRSGSSLE